MIDGEEQSECWGEHRVAGRISQAAGEAREDSVRGKLLTCKGKPQGRAVEVKNGNVEIWDQVHGTARAYFHLAPGFRYEEQHKNVRVMDQDGGVICTVQGMPGDECRVFRERTICSYAPEFGRIERSEVLEISWQGDGSEHMVRLNFTETRNKG